MGIPELTGFLKRSFKNWHPVNWRDWKYVIIDGNNICYALYRKNCTCLLGGEYMDFVRVIKEFLDGEELKLLHKIFIFDGVSCDCSKEATQRRRRIESMEEMCEIQCRSEWDPYTTNKNCPPLHLTNVFMSVLAELKIEFYTAAEGEADREMASLANYYECPVLASDSDFFIYNLKHGFIHFDRYYEQDKNAFYDINEFRKQYSLSHVELCLIIPLVFGNDFHECTMERNYGLLLRTIANYQTCEEYISSSDKPAHIIPASLRERLRLIRDQYNCNLKLPICPLSEFALPHWVKESYRASRFSSQLLEVHVKGSHMLPRVCEVIAQESAWKISRDIRRYLHAFMGKSSTDKVTEVIRKDFLPMLSDEAVKPRNLKTPVCIDDIESMEEQVRSDLVLTVLQGHKISEEVIKEKFKPLPDKWKLPILATFYWYRKLHSSVDKDDLIKALLLSFLTCSQEIENHTEHLGRVRKDTKSIHLQALHAFAQWQCVYCDVIALNKLAREPFHTTSPAYLYSGEVAMYYAMASQHKQHWVDDFLHKGSPQYALFDQFLYLVTGTGEDGRAGKHAPKPKGSSYEQPSSQHQARSRATPTKTQSDLQLSNRFATLPTK